MPFHRPSSALEWTTYIVTCLVRLMVDSMIGYCILSSSLSVKYLELMIGRSTWYLETLVTRRTEPSAFQYFFARMKIVERCVNGAQVRWYSDVDSYAMVRAQYVLIRCVWEYDFYLFQCFPF